MSSLNPTTIGNISLFSNEITLGNISLSGRSSSASRDILVTRKEQFRKDLFDLHYRDLIWKYRYSLIFLKKAFDINVNEAIYWMSKYRMDNELDHCFTKSGFNYDVSTKRFELFHAHNMVKCILRYRQKVTILNNDEITSLLVLYITGFIKDGEAPSKAEDTILLTLLDNYMPYITTDYGRLQYVCYIYAAVSFAGFNTPQMEYILVEHAMFKYDKRTSVRRDDIDDRFRLIDTHVACIMNDFDELGSIVQNTYFMWTMRIFTQYVFPKITVSNKVVLVLYGLQARENAQYFFGYPIFTVPLTDLIIKNGNIQLFDDYMRISGGDINNVIVKIAQNNSIELMNHVLSNYEVKSDIIFSKYMSERSEYTNGIESWIILWNLIKKHIKDDPIEVAEVQFQMVKFLYEMYPDDSFMFSYLLEAFSDNKNFVLYLWLISEHLMSEDDIPPLYINGRIAATFWDQ
jgi:hypothetical protein